MHTFANASMAFVVQGVATSRSHNTLGSESKGDAVPRPDTASLEATSGGGHGNGSEHKTIYEKYLCNIKERINDLDEGWMYNWLFVNLSEWSLSDGLKHGLDRKPDVLASTSDERILIIREKLAQLQTQTVLQSAFFTELHYLTRMYNSQHGFLLNRSQMLRA